MLYSYYSLVKQLDSDPQIKGQFKQQILDEITTQTETQETTESSKGLFSKVGDFFKNTFNQVVVFLSRPFTYDPEVSSQPNPDYIPPQIPERENISYNTEPIKVELSDGTDNPEKEKIDYEAYKEKARIACRKPTKTVEISPGDPKVEYKIKKGETLEINSLIEESEIKTGGDQGITILKSGEILKKGEKRRLIKNDFPMCIYAIFDDTLVYNGDTPNK
jgi:hypothetical protein